MAGDTDKQTELFANARGAIKAMDSAYDVDARNRGRDVVLNASYCGVLPARFVGTHLPRGSISVDCGIGPAGASIAGLWYLEALNVPAAVCDIATVVLGNGVKLYEQSVVSVVNRPAQDCGVKPGMTAREAAHLMLDNDPAAPTASEVTNRTVMEKGPDGRAIICTDSIAFGLPEDIGTNVLLTAGHSGRSCVEYVVRCRPYGYIGSDGGKGFEDSGVAGLKMVEEIGVPSAAVDARQAAMGDGLSTWKVGTISAVNALAAAAGVKVGMSAQEAARLLLNRKPY